jgi:hypothetical protein
MFDINEDNQAEIDNEHQHEIVVYTPILPDSRVRVNLFPATHQRWWTALIGQLIAG